MTDMQLKVVGLLLCFAFTSATSPPLGPFCDSKPCVNGDCINEYPEGYSCKCIPGYFGKNCDWMESPNFGPCSPNPCDNGGECSISFGIKCKCKPGYAGNRCQIRIKPVDHCKPNPCQNYGRCKSDQTGYKCSCNMGHTGANCEIEVRPCTPNPCLNGGKCNVMPKEGFSCSCVGGYGGYNCATPPNPCKPNPCQYSGICESLGGEYKCNCRMWRTGKNCEKAVKPCASNPCLNGGKCYPMPKEGYTCSCADGYEGPNCATRQIIYPESTTEHCLKVKSKKRRAGNKRWMDNFTKRLVNDIKSIWKTAPGIARAEYSAQASVIDGSFEATITIKIWADSTVHIKDLIQHYEDSPRKSKSRLDGGLTICGIATNHCKPNPCRNGGDCMPKLNGYVCTCKGGYGGENCQIDPPTNPCNPNPCGDGGGCILKNRGYVCLCKSGYTGGNCEIKPRGKNHCRPNPCRNGAGCIPKTGGYVCLCKAGYGGTDCQIVRKTCQDHNKRQSGLMDAMMFDCNPDGTYKRKQCDGFLNQCFCVNPKTGDEIDGTRRRSGGYSVDCSIKEPKGKNHCQPNPCRNGAECIPKVGGYVCLCKSGYGGENCQIDRKACQEYNKQMTGYMDAMTFDCNTDGTYKRKQCDGFLGQCFCVNSITGDEIDGSRKRSENFHHDCEACPDHNARMAGMMDAMIFDCNTDGTYKRKQCYGFLNQCYCVDPYTGEEVDGTRMRFEDFNLDCTKKEPRVFPKVSCGYTRMERRKESIDTGVMRIGAYIPSCDLDGNYELMQCNPSSGYCWCVEKMSGKTIDGTEAGPGQFSVDCASVQPKPSRCEPNPCRNGGQCMSKVGGYVCICPYGYKGENCQKGPNHCRPNPCLNGGKCMPKLNGYLCICKINYGGVKCEQLYYD